MSGDIVQLRFDGKKRLLRIRELTGHDLQEVTGTDSLTAIGLVDRLIVRTGTGGFYEGGALDLSIADRDAVAAAVYMKTFGSRISATVRCRSCEARFDLDFSLEDLVADMYETGSSASLSSDGLLCSGNGLKIRPCTGSDELAVLRETPGAGRRKLLEWCIVENPSGVDPTEIESWIETAVPLIDGELDTACVECGTRQQFRFSVQQYLLSKLIAERETLISETHLLASTYGWGLHEIYSLSCSNRKRYAALIGQTRPAERTVWQ